MAPDRIHELADRTDLLNFRQIELEIELALDAADEAKQDDLRRQLRDERMRFYVGDVRDSASVDDAMRGVYDARRAGRSRPVLSLYGITVSRPNSATIAGCG